MVAVMLWVWAVRAAGRPAFGVGATGGKGGAVDEELRRFEGTWRFESVELEGKPMPAEAFRDARLVFEGGRFEITDSFVTHRGTFRVDPAAFPKTVDVEFTEGPEAGKVARGIYRLEGDTYTVCLGLAGRDRPKAFATRPGSGSALEVLTRVKP